MMNLFILVVAFQINIGNSLFNLTGPTEINGIYGKNVNINWEIETDPSHYIWFHDIMIISIFKSNTSLENRLFNLWNRIYSMRNRTFYETTNKELLLNRSSAHQYIIGNNRIVSFAINNLHLDDGDMYILEVEMDFNYDKTIRTKLTVNLPPVLVSYNIRNSYNVTSGENFTLTLEFAGKPQPLVTWTLDGVPLRKTNIKNPSPHNYTYTVRIDGEMLPKPLETKQLNYTASNYVGNISASTTILGIYAKYPYESFIEDIVIQEQSPNNCYSITWEKKQDFKQSNLRYEISYLDARSFMLLTVNISEKRFELCNTTNFLITTYVYDLNGKDIGKDNGIIRNIHPNKIFEKHQVHQVKEYYDTEVIILSVVVIVGLVSAIAFCLMIKSGKVTLKLHTSNKNKDSPVKEEVAINTQASTNESTSDYMELQGVINDTTYEPIATIRSNRNPDITGYVQTTIDNQSALNQQSDYMSLQGIKEDSIYQALTAAVISSSNRNGENNVYEVY